MSTSDTASSRTITTGRWLHARWTQADPFTRVLVKNIARLAVALLFIQVFLSELVAALAALLAHWDALSANERAEVIIAAVVVLLVARFLVSTLWFAVRQFLSECKNVFAEMR